MNVLLNQWNEWVIIQPVKWMNCIVSFNEWKIIKWRKWVKKWIDSFNKWIDKNWLRSLISGLRSNPNIFKLVQHKGNLFLLPKI
jgi:hypothetical protein